MDNKKYKRRPQKKAGLPGNAIALIVLSAALVVVIVILVVLLCMRNGQQEESSSSLPQTSEAQTVEVQTEEPTAEPVITDVTFGSADYSKEFFSKDLFIGDSIATGFTDYSKLNDANVAASVNMTPYKAHAEDITLGDGTTGTSLSYAEKMQPERIFLMLGFNGLSSPNAMEGSFRTLIEKLEEACPDSVIYCYSITPLTANSSAAASAGFDNSNVKSFNEYLRKMTNELGVVYLDINSKMADSSGYLKSDYNEYDGMHISAPTYDLILSYTQRFIQETPEPEASSKHAPVITNTAPQTTASQETSQPQEAATGESPAPEQTSAPEDTSAPEESAPDETSQLSESYSASFFSDDLFIGDSITTGLALYGILPPKNVAAAVGYTPYKAYSTEIQLGDGSTGTAYDYAVKMQPKRIFIMLGSNGITSAASMEDSYRELIDKLASGCPDSTVYCISVTPVTNDSTSATNAGIDNSMITGFNKYIKALTDEKGLTYIDLYSQLSDSSGYFLHDYAENDGLHFKGAAYKVMLNYIENLIG